MKKVLIYCWATGVIEIGKSCPNGAIPLATASKKHAKNILDGISCISWSNQWLVPKSDEWVEALMRCEPSNARKAALASVIQFKHRLIKGLNKKR